METLLINDLIEYVENNIVVFHEKRIEKIGMLKLTDVLKKKNPYLFKAKYLESSQEIIEELVSAFISSSEETMFGDWLEGLAIYINGKVYSGWKSGIKGIDLEFDKHDTRYIVSIKSGPNWGNSSQIEKMIKDFNAAQKTLRTSNSRLNIICVNGCCYGKDNKPDKGTYFKYCGQTFWEFIGGNKNIYTDIIEPLGHNAEKGNADYLDRYAQLIKRFTREFTELFCDDDGVINWNTLAAFNSGKS